MSSSRSSLLFLFGSALLALLLVGCGSSNNGVAAKNVQEILAATSNAAAGASSVHVTARAAARRVRSVLDAGLSGDRGHAKVSLLGVDFEVIRVGNTLYVKGNRVFSANLQANLGVKVPPGEWLKGPTNGALGRISSFTKISTEMPVLLGGSGPLTKGATVKVRGRPAIEVIQTRKLSTATLYVATTGEPYPLLLRKSGREAGQTTFTEWNKPVRVDPPANAVEIGQLQHTGR
jgi:hypothetical protein